MITMPRIRTIKPEHWNDAGLPDISLPAHLLWIGTWNFSDDKGIFEADTLLLKAQIFPRRQDVRVEQVKQWIDQLVKARYLIPFTWQGRGYYINRTFGTHQRIDKPQPSKIPDTVIVEAFQEYSKNDPGSFPLYSRVKESRVKESKGPAAPDDFLKKIIYPFTTENFITAWEGWKNYKVTQYKFKYKSPETEQAALKELGKLAGEDELKALAIIQQSIANGWKGFFDLKQNFNGTHQQGAGKGGKLGTSEARIERAKNW